MSNALRIGAIVAIAIALLASGIALGYVLNSENNHNFVEQIRSINDGIGNMMGGPTGFGGTMDGISPDADLVPQDGKMLSLDDAVEVAEAYIARYRSVSLEIVEVMQFDNHFYAQATESDTGIHAFEILIDPFTAKVYLEPGPNMMWNTKYGMMRGSGMMGSFQSVPADKLTVSPEQARELAQAKLERSQPGMTVDEEVDIFYGYYTIHTLRDGEVIGMLSVNGYTGQVWIHTWHGEFIGMTDHSHG
jgi:hypothetical protein